MATGARSSAPPTARCVLRRRGGGDDAAVGGVGRGRPLGDIAEDHPKLSVSPVTTRTGYACAPAKRRSRPAKGRASLGIILTAYQSSASRQFVNLSTSAGSVASGRVGACAVNEAIDATVVPAASGQRWPPPSEAQPVWPLGCWATASAAWWWRPPAASFPDREVPEAAAGYAHEHACCRAYGSVFPCRAALAPRPLRGVPQRRDRLPAAGRAALGDRLPAGADRQRIAADLAAFLWRCRFPVEDAADVALPGPAADKRFKCLRDAVLPF